MNWRTVVLFAPGVVGAIVLLLLDPIAQDPHYHDFADQRTVWGIPYFGDVVTNLGFVIVGALGLWKLRIADAAFRDPREKRPFAVFFVGILLTGLGSGWYHLDPNNATLIWDRLPMTLAFMGFFSAILVERIDKRLGLRLLGPLVALGIASVCYWAWRDDLRPYAFVQFYPLVATAIMLGLYATPYTCGDHYGLALASYVAAKATETYDHQIMRVLGAVSGHNLKHVLAAIGAWWVYRMLGRRLTSGTGCS